MTISKVGRPSISESEVPSHIFEGLLHKSRGATWADSATAVGIKYQTLRMWVNENEEAESSTKKQSRNDKKRYKTDWIMLTQYLLMKHQLLQKNY